MTFTATEGTTAPIVLGKEPIEKPPFKRDPRGFFMVHCHQTIAITDVQSNTVATVIARIGDFICTFHAARYEGWYTGWYGRMLGKDTVVTWERIPG